MGRRARADATADVDLGASVADNLGGMIKRIGTLLLIAGLASFVLPLVGLQLKIFNALGESQTMVGIGAIVLGVVLPRPLQAEPEGRRPSG